MEDINSVNSIVLNNSCSSFQTQRNSAIDLFKFICSLFVIMIHVPPFGRYSEHPVSVFVNFVLVDGVARIAVPFFFICSGFFLYRRTSLRSFTTLPTKRYIFRLLRLYMIWSIIYFPLKIQSFFDAKIELQKAAGRYLWQFLLGDSYAHLWYLPATVFAVCIISFLLSRRISPLKILAIAIPFYVIGLLGQSWFGLIRPIKSISPPFSSLLQTYQIYFGTTRNGLFEGFLFVSIGMIFAFYDVKLSKPAIVTSGLLCLALLLTEAICLNKISFVHASDMYLFLPLTALFLFLLVKQIKLDDRPIFCSLRILSSFIFFIHLLVYKLITSDDALGNYAYLGTLIISILLSIGILRLASCKKFKWVRFLYS